MTWAPEPEADGLRRYGSNTKIKEDPTRCIASVSDGFMASRQCQQKRKVGDYCGVHDPVRRNAKDDARREKWQKEWADDRARQERKAAIESAERAVIEAAEKWAVDRLDSDQSADDFVKTCDALHAAVAHLRSVRESK